MDNAADNAHGSDFGDLRALYVNCILMDKSIAIMQKQGVNVERELELAE
jgi:hypothetical protein